MEIKILESEKKIRVETDIFSTEWLPDSSANRKTFVIFFRSLLGPDGKNLFTHQESANIVGSNNRQASDQHLKDFRNCGKDFLQTLVRKRKVDSEVLEAVESILIADPLINIREICEKMDSEYSLSVTEANVQTAIEEISYHKIRSSIKKKIESGEIQYKEKELFKEIFEELEQTKKGSFSTSDIPATDPTAIRKMVTPGFPVSDIPMHLKMIVFSMVLFYWGIPLSVLGNWFVVHKTTILRRIMGMSNCLYPIFQRQIWEKVNPLVVLIDEKWLKIKGKWYYWFVVIDNKTNLPLLSQLLPSRGKMACIFIGMKLKQLGIIPKVIKTDGLRAYSYVSAILGAIHSICIFHHQQAVIRWLKKNFKDKDKITELKKIMRRIFQTSDKRTVLRRIKRLKDKAEELGISSWFKSMENNLGKLINSIGSKKIPLTSNGIERFFRGFSRFYKTRSGFTTVASAKKELDFYQLMYMLIIRHEKGTAPIEEIFSEAKETPLYKLVNNPLKYIFNVKNVKLESKMAYFDGKILLKKAS